METGISFLARTEIHHSKCEEEIPLKDFHIQLVGQNIIFWGRVNESHY